MGEPSQVLPELPSRRLQYAREEMEFHFGSSVKEFDSKFPFVRISIGSPKNGKRFGVR